MKIIKHNWHQYAVQFITQIGGKDNLQEIYHCATRLRFILIDDSKFDVNLIKQTPYYKGYNKQDNQHQIIIGSGLVDKMYNEVQKIIEDKNNASDLKLHNKQRFWKKELSIKDNVFLISKRGLNSFASIFVPLVPVFIAGGMSLAFKSLLEQLINNPNSGFIKILDVIGGGILGSIPVFIGYTAAKKWGGNPFLGMAMGMILISPTLLNSYSVSTPILLEFALGTKKEIIDLAVNAKYAEYIANIQPGITPPEISQVVGVYYTIFSGAFKIKLIGYQAQVVPVLLALGLSVNVERLLKKFTPEVLAVIVVPLVSVIFSSWIAFWLIAPLGQIIGQGLSIALTAIFKYTNWMFIGFGGFILAGFYPLLVVTGLHQGFLPIETQLLTSTQITYGHSFSFITPIACVSNIAQGTAAFMLLFFSKNKVDKSKAISSSFGGYTGITEPAMFGINLQIKPLFIAAMIGSALGGWWLGMTHTVANSLGSASWIGLVQFDWTTKYTLQYFADEQIHAVMKNVPMGVHATIAMLISLLGSAGSASLLMRTKWGKNSIRQYLKQTVIQLQ